MGDEEDIKNIDNLLAKHLNEEEEDFVYEDYPSEDEDCETTEVEESREDKSETDLTKLETFPESSCIAEYDKAIINSCPNPQLKQLLLLNRQKLLQLNEMHRTVKELLLQCQLNIAEHENNIKLKTNTVVKRCFARIWKMGIPYFKTSDGFPCPDNAEALSKARNGEVLFYDMTPLKYWASVDINRLLKGVSFYHKANKETELMKRLSVLEETGGSETEKNEILAQIENLKNKDTVLYPKLGTEKDLNWQRIALKFLRDKYCVEDCQIFWRFCAHPDLNKDQWKPEEVDRLSSLVAKHNCQNWDLIAEELDTNRSGFMVCRHYLSKVNPPKLTGKFTPEEDQKLTQLVRKYTEGGVISWYKIVQQFKGRTRGQLLNRYKYYLNLGDNISKDKFTEAEDILLLVLIDRFGTMYSKCAQYFPNRTIIQLKSRYNTTLRAGVKKGYFEEKEDEMILQHVEKHGETWNQLAPILGRRNDQLRQRYKTLVRFMKTNPWATIRDAPRRKFLGDSGQNTCDWLKYVASKFKNYPTIPTLNDVEQLLKKQHALLPYRGVGSTILGVVQKSDEQDDHLIVSKMEEDGTLPSLSIDDVITDYFVNSFKIEFEEMWSHGNMWQETAAAVGNVLATLQANLYVPVNFEKKPNLDQIDLKIMECLVDGTVINSHNQYELKSELSEVEWVVPPTLNTVVGMRNLLLKNQTFKTERTVKKQHADYQKERSEEQMLWCINSHLSNQPPHVQVMLEKERQLFTSRYFSLFKLPAVMSLVQPHSQLTASIYESGLEAPRTYGKKNKNNFAAAGSKPNKASIAEEMRRRLNETLNNLKPKKRPARRAFFAKKETTATVTELPEETETNRRRLERIGVDKKPGSKRAKIEEVKEEEIVKQQDIEDLKMLEAVLSTKPEEEDNFDID